MRYELNRAFDCKYIDMCEYVDMILKNVENKCSYNTLLTQK